MSDVLAELEGTAGASLDWLLLIAQIVRYKGVDRAWKLITEPTWMTDEEARQVLSDAIADAAATEPTVFARFKATRQWLEDGARRGAALFEAREGRPPRIQPLRFRPPYPPVIDEDARLMVLVIAVTVASTLPADPPDDDPWRDW